MPRANLQEPHVIYFRLHGSPRKYWSRYDKNDIATVAMTVHSIATAAEVWCVFDNRKRRRYRECLGIA